MNQETLQQALAFTESELSREREYQRLIDASLPVGTIILRIRDNMLLHVGGTLLSEIGYTWDEYAAFQKNKLHSFVLPEDYGTRFHNACERPDEAPKEFEQEFRARCKDGSIAWLYEKGKLVQMADGAHVYIIVCMNVTARKEIEERLRVSQEELSLAMAQMGKQICLYDVASHTLTLPETYANTHGLPAVIHNVPRKADDYHVFSNAEHDTFSSYYQRILNGEQSGTLEARMRLANGEWRWERAEFATVFDADGKPIKAIIAMEDTTRQHEMDDENEVLRENERVFKLVAAHSNRLTYRYDVASKTAYADPQDAKRANAPSIDRNVPESVIARGTVLPESVADYRRMFCEIDAGKLTGSAKVHMLAADHSPRWVDMRYSIIDFDGNGRAKSAVLSYADITAEHERELAYERYRQMIRNDSAKESIVYFETDLTADLVEKQGGNVSGLAFPACGCTHDSMVGYGIGSLIVEDARARAWAFFGRKHLLALFEKGSRSLAEDWPVLLPGGNRYWFRADVQMIRDPYSAHIKVYTTLRDVTAEVLTSLNVKKLAETDGMTGLYNKSTTEALVKQRLTSSVGEPCMLFIADLDNLKSINDALGHAQGDRALSSMADALRAQFRHTDIIGRIGGDEFLAFLDGAGNEVMMRSSMVALLRKLSKLRLGENNDVPMHASIGIAMGTTGSATFGELYRMADQALYHVKRNGKNDYAFYTPDMEEAAYQYHNHEEAEIWRADGFKQAELDALLYAVSSIYPLVISVNLTDNSYYMLRYEQFKTHSCFEAGVFDELIAEGSGTFRPDDRTSFLAAFSRENLLHAFARGEKSVTHRGWQRGDDGVYRCVQTDVIFLKQDGPGSDVKEITLARVLDDAGKFNPNPHE